MESSLQRVQPHLANRGPLGHLRFVGCRPGQLDAAPEDRVQAQFDHIQKTHLHPGQVEGSVVYSTYLSGLP